MDDDSVVIEGSPLHQYMKELELNNLNFDEKLNFKENNKKEICVHGFWYNTSIKEYFYSKCIELRSKISYIFPLSQDILVSLSRQYYTEYGRLILNSKIILEDDIDYLCLQTPHQFLKSVNVFSNNQDLNYSRYSALIGFLLFGILSIFLSDFTPNFVQLLSYLIVFFVICFNIRLEIIIEMWKRRHESNLKLLRKFLATSEQLNSVIRKSIQIIQEIEVVSRGFKLVNGRTPISRLENGNSPTSRLFTKLRFVVLRSTVRSTIACRRATLDLLKYKINVDCDCDQQSYICNIPVKDLGACFVESTTSVEMFNITEGYSLSVLKSLNEVLIRQRSELLTRLSLTLSGITWDFTSEGFIENFKSLLDEPYKTTVDCITSLQCSYDGHKNADNMRKENLQAKQDSAPNTNITSVLKINLRSLQVHMRAAMHNSIDFEENLKINKDDESNLQITEKFEKVKMHLESGLECYEQCLKEINLLTYNHTTKTTSDNRLVEIQPQDDSKEEDNEFIEIDEDIILEDQVYEGIAGNSDSDNEVESNSKDLVEPSKKIKEESESVIQELRSVLAVKTCEKQREMWKKQLFPSYKGKNNGGDTTMANNAINNGTYNKNNDNNELDNEDNYDDNNNGFYKNNGLKVKNHGINKVDPHAKLPEDFDNLAETLLKVPRRVSAPGRPPTRKNLRKLLQNNHDNLEDYKTFIHDNNANYDNINYKKLPSNNNANIKSQSYDEQPDWSRGLGIGFSASMAQQVARIAQTRVNLTKCEILSSENGVEDGLDSD